MGREVEEEGTGEAGQVAIELGAGGGKVVAGQGQGLLHLLWGQL